MGGGGGGMPKPLTQEEILEDTSNEFVNPVSKEATPSWKKKKPQKNKNKLMATTTSDTYQG
jgi:hypothetical protein